MAFFKRTSNNVQSTVQSTIALFFDRAEVIRQMTERERKAMSKIGAYIRRSMQTSMKKSNSKTPHADEGDAPRFSAKLIRDLIFFSYSPRSHSVVVGPALIPSKPTIRPIGKTVPQLLDEGGYARAKTHFALRHVATGKLVSISSTGGRKILNSSAYKNSKGKKTAKWKLTKVKSGVVRFKPRPFKQPALEKNITQPKLASAWSVIS